MKNKAITRVYIATCMVLGGALFLHGCANWHPADPAKFVCYLALALFASILKVRLPGVTGTMSVNYLFILLAIAELSLGEVVVIGVASTVLQTFWHAKKRPKVVQLGFNLASMSISIGIAFGVHHAALEWSKGQVLIVLIITATVYFLVNTFSVAIVISLSERKPLLRLWRQCYFWSFAYYLAGASMVALMTTLNAAFGWQVNLLPVPVLYLLFRSYRIYLNRLEGEMQHAEEVAKLHMRTIEALALAIEAKDETTHEHLERVQHYAVEIGKDLNLSEDELQALKAAAVLHDIGKLAVPEHIISKPGKLTPEEFEKMKIHPTVGAQILERVKFPYPVVPIVRAHHERWDGSGYPNGLKGKEIPLGARILAAVDCLDALASHRQYRRAIPLDDAMEFVVSESGKSFDPAVVA
ncbi:MAG: HD domain-containing protein, partial [Acidobacteriia bacterium]|nr:HD domain-containing protein [Terriglobia bacterium]